MVTGIIISAGLSSGMGRTKALLDYEGAPFIIQIMVKMSYVCDRLILVLGKNIKEIDSYIKKYLNSESDSSEKNLIKERLLKIKDEIKAVENDDAEKGIISTLKAGLKAAGNEGWVLCHFVDQPGLPYSFYEDFVLQIDENFDWIQPMYRTKPGHPILLSHTVFELILNFKDHKSLKDFSNENHLNKKFWNCSFSEVLQDIDSMKEYKSIFRS